MEILAVIIAILVSMLLVLVRAVMGPTLYDRILAANAFGTKSVIVIALLVHVLDNTMYIDIALIYALVNFITTIAFLRFFRYKSFKGEGDSA